MTHEEWRLSTDVPLMLEAIWEGHCGDETVLVPLIHRYLLACCRRIWQLLPDADSRRGIETAEQYLIGVTTCDELKDVNWYVEGVAFNIDYNCDPDSIEQWMQRLRLIPGEEMAAMLHPPGVALDVDARVLLERAAYFAHYATMYPNFRSKRGVPVEYVPFLSAELLREQFVTPFQGEGNCI
jgi:hypothetical protein